MIRDLPDEALVPWGWAKRILGNTALAVEPRRMVDTTRAAEILGMDLRATRRLHARCERKQNVGYPPAVHVGRNGASEHSALLFDEDDCWAFRRQNGPSITIVDATTDADTPEAAGEAIADALMRAEFGGHG